MRNVGALQVVSSSSVAADEDTLWLTLAHGMIQLASAPSVHIHIRIPPGRVCVDSFSTAVIISMLLTIK